MDLLSYPCDSFWVVHLAYRAISQKSLFLLQSQLRKPLPHCPVPPSHIHKVGQESCLRDHAENHVTGTSGQKKKLLEVVSAFLEGSLGI